MDKHMMVWKEQVKLVRHTDDVNYNVQNVMIPALTDEELKEYVRERSGEVKIYKLEDDNNDNRRYTQVK